MFYVAISSRQESYGISCLRQTAYNVLLDRKVLLCCYHKTACKCCYVTIFSGQEPGSCFCHILSEKPHVLCCHLQQTAKCCYVIIFIFNRQLLLLSSVDSKVMLSCYLHLQQTAKCCYVTIFSRQQSDVMLLS